MSLADKVRTEQQQVAKGSAGCSGTHPDNGLSLVCVRQEHLPDDMVHVGQIGGALIQWEDL